MSNAVISTDHRFRYRLDRNINMRNEVVAFFGINPSTADASQDDPTIRKMKGFAGKNGFGKIIVGNVFAYRATDVRELADFNDPIGEDNDHHIGRILFDCDAVVVCWGNTGKVPRDLVHHIYELDARIIASGKPRKCIGQNVNGDPKHPARVPYGQFIDWPGYACNV